jgi:UDPglucose 6-dehydrogenase
MKLKRESYVMDDRQSETISVIGLGKLGAPMVAVFADAGFNVIGVDVNSSYVDALSRGEAPVEEPRLQEFLDRNSGRIRATTQTSDAILNSHMTFVIVPTPSLENKLFSNEYVLSAIQQIGESLRDSDKYHVVNVTSTVMPGSTGGVIREVLEDSSGRAVGANLGLCYNPEFIALGSVINDMLEPDMILIGESDKKAGDAVEAVYRRSIKSNPEIQRMNFVNAELCKIAVNTYVTTKISYANMIAEMCDQLDGADAHIVSHALGADSRIGRKYIRPAIGYGGPCFPRDNKAFAALARSLGVRCDLAEATDKINDHQPARLAKIVNEFVAPGATVGILGLSYKPETGVVEESQGLQLANLLAAEGYAILASDPRGLSAAHRLLDRSVHPKPDLQDVISESDAVIFMTPWSSYRDLDKELFIQDGRPKLVIDPWRIYAPGNFDGVARHIVPGAIKA